MLSIRRVAALVASLPLMACVTSPSSRTSSESSSSVALSGFALSPGQTVTITAVDQNTGNPVTRGTATTNTSGLSFTTPSGTSYTLYPWSFNAGVLPANFWSPQSILPDLRTAPGHLEIFASAGNNTLPTFSQAAYASVNAAINSGVDPLTAGETYTDGSSTVLFDQDGVGSGPETAWVNVQGMISTPPAGGYPSVAWSVGSYTVGGKKIYGLICEPTTPGPYPVVIYNHGGTDGTNGGNISGAVTASGWTSPPTTGPDGLGQCLDWAKRGWVFATSAYRGESVEITSASPSFPAPATPWTSGGSVEFCMGEVTDVLALTDLVVNHASTTRVGSASQTFPINGNGKVFMYGYSHGGCITHRAVEEGAPVTAFSVIEGFTDLRLHYLNLTNLGVTQTAAAVASGAFTPTGAYLPDAAGVMGYNWRSAHYFASRGDLSIQKLKSMPILIFHGDIDLTNPVNPVFLDEPVELAADIGATNIFVGPTGVSPPTSEPCIAGTVGAPIPDTTLKPTASCPVSFTSMDTGDPCVSAGVQVELGLCSFLPLPLAPAAGQPQQNHYLVVYHNMDHTNGGLAIKETFDRFAELNFFRQPGCDGIEIGVNCASD